MSSYTCLSTTPVHHQHTSALTSRDITSGEIRCWSILSALTLQLFLSALLLHHKNSPIIAAATANQFSQRSPAIGRIQLAQLRPIIYASPAPSEFRFPGCIIHLVNRKHSSRYLASVSLQLPPHHPPLAFFSGYRGRRTLPPEINYPRDKAPLGSSNIKVKSLPRQYKKPPPDLITRGTPCALWSRAIAIIARREDGHFN